MTTYTRRRNIIRIHVDGEVLKRITVDNARIGVRLSQFDDGLVILGVMVHYVLTDLRNV